MKGFLIISAIFLLSSCQERKSRIAHFEEVLTVNDRSVLNQWIEFYNKLLIDNYPSAAPKSLLRDIVNDRDSTWVYDRKEMCRLLDLFNSSTIDFRFENRSYDTVFLGKTMMFDQLTDTMVLAVTQEGDTSATIEVVPDDPTWNGQVRKIKEDGYWYMLNESSLVNALKHDSVPDDIAQYVDMKIAVADMSHCVLAAGMLEADDINLDDYFIKGILVVDVLVAHLSDRCND